MIHPLIMEFLIKIYLLFIYDQLFRYKLMISNRLLIDYIIH